MSKKYQNISAVILAGGQSSRMGGTPKDSLEIAGGRMIDHILRALKPLFTEIIIVTNNKDRFKEFKSVKVVKDIVTGCGPLGGIYTGLKSSSKDKVFFVACDMPFLHRGLISKLLTAAKDGDYDCIIPCSDKGIEPLHAIYSKGILKDVEDCLKKRNLAVRDALQHCKCRYISPHRDELTSFVNVNNFSDLTQSKVEVFKLVKGKKIKEEETVTNEITFAIYLQNKRLCTLLCSPVDLRALCIGFLYSRGLIQTTADIAELKLGYKNHNAHVRLRARRLPRISKERRKYRITTQNIIKLMKAMENRAITFKQTGGVHCAALSDEERILLFQEDIGRHNAIDKVIGQALIQGFNMSDLIFLTSGRISSEIISKVKRTGSSCLISPGAPTDQAIRLAKEADLSLIGFMRNQRMNVYSGAERII